MTHDEFTEHHAERHEVHDNQAPQYEAQEGPHDTSYQPAEQGDGGAYQPHMRETHERLDETETSATRASDDTSFEEEVGR